MQAMFIFSHLYVADEQNTPTTQQRGGSSQQGDKRPGDDSLAVEMIQSSSETPGSEMDPKMKKDLEFILDKNLKEIITKYASYVDCVRECVEEKGVTPEKLQTYLLSLPATTRAQELTLLSDKKKELLETKTITEIFNFLITECTSFLNYDIFQRMLEKYKVDTDQEELQRSQTLH